MFYYRSWFQIRNMGHSKIRMLEGSLDDWKAAGGPMEEGPKKAVVASELDTSKASSYVASDAQQMVSMDQVKAVLEDGSKTVVDVRSRDRFTGAVEEPRPGLRRGHMPGAINLPFTELLNPDNVVTLLSPADVEARLEEAGISVQQEKDIVATCGSGVTACALVAALQYCGRDPSKTFVFDGSWIEWGPEDAGTPVETTADKKD